jgi:siroheme decarboxylase
VNTMQTFTIQEKKAAQILQKDIPLQAKPFAAIANSCGLESDELMTWLQKLSRQGIIRKFGAILRHQKAGYSRNALVMWAVPPDSIEFAGEKFASLSFISHCYERSPAFQNRYNLFTMLHAQDEKLAALIRQMSQTIHCDDFLVLESRHEYKKTSPEYF